MFVLSLFNIWLGFINTKYINMGRTQSVCCIRYLNNNFEDCMRMSYLFDPLLNNFFTHNAYLVIRISSVWVTISIEIGYPCF